MGKEQIGGSVQIRHFRIRQPVWIAGILPGGSPRYPASPVRDALSIHTHRNVHGLGRCDIYPTIGILAELSRWFIGVRLFGGEDVVEGHTDARNGESDEIVVGVRENRKLIALAQPPQDIRQFGVRPHILWRRRDAFDPVFSGR
ncbi:hypothetical protein QFZ34_000372 [Phyllobacterium ifriqiyense]|uniref:Uncharacterized protein n=1 Tax=Phyllobacterium ifriqiyense TaxID=314238 RepID=A0ABU0S349_9HYPH|nr:hypothetical protein [Phyllobacterium ifriqiyense]